MSFKKLDGVLRSESEVWHIYFILTTLYIYVYIYIYFNLQHYAWVYISSIVRCVVVVLCFYHWVLTQSDLIVLTSSSFGVGVFEKNLWVLQGPLATEGRVLHRRSFFFCVKLVRTHTHSTVTNCTKTFLAFPFPLLLRPLLPRPPTWELSSSKFWEYLTSLPSVVRISAGHWAVIRFSSAVWTCQVSPTHSQHQTLPEQIVFCLRR